MPALLFHTGLNKQEKDRLVSGSQVKHIRGRKVVSTKFPSILGWAYSVQRWWNEIFAVCVARNEA